jgi:Bacterial SH3 domain
MRKIVFTAFLVLAVHAIGAQDIAFCNNGPLRIRKASALAAEILGSVDTYEKVTILERTAKTQSVDGFDSYWYRIRTQAGLEGWAFGGYLEVFSQDQRTAFNELFSMELPAGSKASAYPCMLLGNDQSFVLTQSYAVNYLGSTIDLVVYYVPRETTRIETLRSRFGCIVNASPPSIPVERLSALLEADPTVRQTSDWTSLQVTVTNLTSEMTHDLLIAHFSAPDNALFSEGFLVFHNLWKDSKDSFISKVNLWQMTVQIVQKRIFAQNYEMVFNALSTIHLSGSEGN